MIKNKDYTFNVTISNKNYQEKPTSSEISKITWTTEEVTTDELVDLFINGYSISNIYNKDSVTATERCYDNFKGSYTIYVDVDYTKYENMYDYIENLEYKPTFGYYSFSDGLEKKGIVSRRFRLCYVFNKMITDIDFFKGLSKNILTKVVSDTQEKMEDSCTLSPNQYMNGTNNKDDFYISYQIYSIRDFGEVKKNEKIEKVQKRLYNREEDNIIDSHLHFFNEDSEFIKDYWNLCFEELIMKYRNIYEYFDRTPLPQVDDDTKYIILPDDYCEIKRYWILDKGIDEEGNTRWVQSFVRRIKDGEGRKRKLFINGCYRRKMMPNINFEHLLFCLVYELYFYVENTKDVITNKQLFDIALNVMKYDYTKYTKDMEHPKFIVNPNYCIKYNLSKNQVSKMARKEIKYAEIGNLYDCLKTDKENLKVLKENGIKICLRTLQNFKKENGLQKN
jgi:hypothetical protein